MHDKYTGLIDAIIQRYLGCWNLKAQLRIQVDPHILSGFVRFVSQHLLQTRGASCHQERCGGSVASVSLPFNCLLQL